MTHYQKKELAQFLRVAVSSSLVGLAFAFGIHYVMHSLGGIENLVRFLFVGFFTGLGVSTGIMGFEILLGRWVRNPPLVLIVIGKPLVYTAIIIGVHLSLLLLFFSSLEHLGGRLLPYTIGFSLLLTFLINAFQTINRLLGQNVLPRLLVGKYNHPVEEERFFLFLDLIGSTGIAESIGDKAFHELLRDFFNDITESLLACKAEIYKYVGDEVILTWKTATGIKDGNALKVFFACEDRMAELKNKYLKRYGLIPGFRAGLHHGNVVVGEMGSYKMEIAYLGDVMNTAARIQSACSEHGVTCLVSGAALERFDRPEDFGCVRKMGTLTLRGKTQMLDLYTLTRHSAAQENLPFQPE